MTRRKLYKKLSVFPIIVMMAVFIPGLLTNSYADYYDWEGNYHDDYGYIYASYGYYDPYGSFHEYGSRYAEPVLSEDGLRATDPNGFYQYVPIFYKADVHEERVEQRRAEIPVGWVGQNPEMPNGCEATATTIALNYYGFRIDKLTMGARYFYQADHPLDFREFYVGNPLDITGLGCYSNAVVRAANQYLSEQETELHAFSYTNYPFESLLNQVADGYPVIIWATIFMYEPYYGVRIDIDGTDIVWISQEHCMVLCGYDLDRKKVKVSDPLAGITEYDMDLFKKRFTQLGFHAVIIKTAGEQVEEEKEVLSWPFNDQFLPADQFVRGCKGFDGVSEANQATGSGSLP